MCSPHKIAPDWVVKGCHIEVNGIELALRPDHEGRVMFSSVFSGTPENLVKAAIKIAMEICITDPKIRESWIAKLEMATVYMLALDTEDSLARLANGRMFEFKLLKIAIQRWA